MSKDIEVIDIVDQEDGSALMTMDVEPEQVNAFAHMGLRYLIEQMQLQEAIEDISPNTFEESTRTMELTNDELNILFQFGVISAIKRGMGNEQNKEEEEDGGQVSG